MSFIKDLQILKEKDDLSKLPEDVIKKLKKLIRDGATDLAKKWENSLELVTQAYKVESVTIPTPALRTAYSQFDEMLKYAVKEMFDARKGMDDDWRMSSTVFREFKESMEREVTIRIYEISPTAGAGHTVKAKNMDEVVEMVRKQAGAKHFDMDVEQHDDSSCTCNFSFQGIKRPYKIELKQL